MIVNLANEFVTRDIDTDIVLSRAEGPYVSEVDERVNIVNLEAPELPGYSALGALKPLRRYLEYKKPDAFLSALTRANIVALSAHRTTNVPARMVVSERNNLSKRIKEMGKLRFRVLPWIVRATYRWADAIIPISEGVGDDLARTANISREKMRTIHNPAYSPTIEQRAVESPNHPWFSEANRDYKLLLGTGSLSQQKDFSTLLRAFQRLQKRTDTRLVILGEGEKRGELEALARRLGIFDSVDFPGFVDNPFAYMTRADVFVLSSAWEGFGNVIVESMACGTPVVSTDCPSGPAEILEDGKFGPLVPVGDHAALAEAIEKVLEDPPDEKVIRNRAREFSIETIANQYLEILLPRKMS